MECIICKTKGLSANSLRFGVCWECVQAESIIDTGLDMDDKGLSTKHFPAKLPIDKLRLLISKGWYQSTRMPPGYIHWSKCEEKQNKILKKLTVIFLIATFLAFWAGTQIGY